MDRVFIFMAFFVLLMILLLETASLLPKGSRGRRTALGLLLILVVGVVGITTGMMLSHQLPSLTLTVPTFVLTAPS